MANNEEVSGRYDFLAWPIVFGMAVAIQAVTGNALIAALPIAIHAGWRLFRCGWWLRSIDPVSRRAWACFWFYLAAACWKASAYAFATIVILGVIENLAGQPVPMDEAIAELQVMSCSVVLSTIVGILAVALAVRGKVRVWVHPSVREKCGGDFSRLGEIRGWYTGNPGTFYGGFNHAIFILIAAVFFPLPLAGTVLFVCKSMILPFRPALDAFDILVVCSILIGPLVAIPAYVFLTSRIIARTPTECWTPGEEGREGGKWG